MTTHTKGQRTPETPGGVAHGPGYSAVRPRDSRVGRITTSGRTSVAKRQEIADGFAAITETATVIPEKVHGVYGEYRIEFEVTHKVVPL